MTKMKNILLTVFAGAALAGITLAQNTTGPASGSTPPEQQQTPAATPSQALPESSAQQSQTPEPQQAPPTQDPSTAQPSATQPTDQPSAANRQVPAPSATSGAPKLAPGSVIPVLLTKGIDAKKAKTGDEVIAKVTQDMKTSSGDVLVPKDTRVIGHVTEAQARSKEQKESQVGLSFDRAVMKNGNEMQLPMSIQAIIGQETNNVNTAGGNDQPSSAPAAGSSGATAGGSGRASGMSGSAPPPTSSASNGASNVPSDAQTGTNAHGPITAQTQGVVGISNLKLSTTTQGSVLSSEKNNVKLDSGTMMLLKVNE